MSTLDPNFETIFAVKKPGYQVWKAVGKDITLSAASLDLLSCIVKLEYAIIGTD